MNADMLDSLVYKLLRSFSSFLPPRVLMLSLRLTQFDMTSQLG